MKLFQHKNPEKTPPAILEIPTDDLKINFSGLLGNGRTSTFKAIWKDQGVVVKLVSVYSGPCTEEAEHLSMLSHPNIISLIGVYHVSPAQNPRIAKEAVVLPYYSGGDLKTFLASKQPMSWHIRYQLSIDIARAIEYIHQEGVIHREINPSNILLRDSIRAVLCDFNYAVMRSPKTIYKAARLLPDAAGGDPAYIAPELGENFPAYSGKADIFAFAITLWAITTRQRPWRYCYPNEWGYDWTTKGLWGARFTPDTPASFASLVQRCWLEDQTQRPTAETTARLIEASARTEKITLSR